MQKLNRQHANLASNPIKVLQFGGGNFLRAFVDWIIDVYNEETGSDLGVLVVKPTRGGDYQAWREQDGLYHIISRGLSEGRVVDESRLIKCVSQIVHPYHDWEGFLKSAENPDLTYVVSNTTESGIKFSLNDLKTDTPPHEFPAKLTLWLHHRYRFFEGKKEAGCVFVPTELLIDNGQKLKETILEYAGHWQLEEGFATWISEANAFCNTLVDRIVPGISKEKMPEMQEKIGYEDVMATQGEPYHFLAIEAPKEVREKLPLDKIGLNIVYTNDITPYRERKVRILNGAHTSMVPVGYLYGIDTVREAVEHEVMGKFIQQAIYDEIIPTLDLSKEELTQFAGDVLDRFKNPFIRHQLISISLNSVSKYRTRVLPSVLEYEKRNGSLPEALVFSMASMVHFYKGERNGEEIPLKDDPDAISFLKNEWHQCDLTESGFLKMAENILKWEYAWQQDLSQVGAYKELLADFLFKIEKEGMQAALKALLA